MRTISRDLESAIVMNGRPRVTRTMPFVKGVNEGENKDYAVVQNFYCAKSRRNTVMRKEGKDKERLCAE